MDEAWFETLVVVHLSSVISAAETSLKKGLESQTYEPVEQEKQEQTIKQTHTSKN